jgi:urea transport system permease protein
MSGAFDLGGLAITYNRLWIIVFSWLVFAGAAGDPEAHPIRPADARRHPEPAHGAAMGIRTGRSMR